MENDLPMGPGDVYRQKLYVSKHFPSKYVIIHIVGSLHHCIFLGVKNTFPLFSNEPISKVVRYPEYWGEVEGVLGEGDRVTSVLSHSQLERLYKTFRPTMQF